MIANLWMAFDDRARPTANAVDEDGHKHEAFKALGDPSVRGIFRKDNPNGPRDYELWSLYYDVETAQEVGKIRDKLHDEFTGQIRTIGAWWWDGREVGTEWVDEVGGETREQPLFPQHNNILEFVPDTDEFGTRPTALADVNLGLGQTPRRF